MIMTLEVLHILLVFYVFSEFFVKFHMKLLWKPQKIIVVRPQGTKKIFKKKNPNLHTYFFQAVTWTHTFYFFGLSNTKPFINKDWSVTNSLLGVNGWHGQLFRMTKTVELNKPKSSVLFLWQNLLKAILEGSYQYNSNDH